MAQFALNKVLAGLSNSNLITFPMAFQVSKRRVWSCLSHSYFICVNWTFSLLLWSVNSHSAEYNTMNAFKGKLYTLFHNLQCCDYNGMKRQDNAWKEIREIVGCSQEEAVMVGFLPTNSRHFWYYLSLPPIAIWTRDAPIWNIKANNNNQKWSVWSGWISLY